MNLLEAVMNAVANTHRTDPGQGLVPLAQRQTAWDAYGGGDGNDLHIALSGEPTPANLGLWAALLQAGAKNVPPSILGAEVILGEEAVSIFAHTNQGETWAASYSNEGPHRGWTFGL